MNSSINYLLTASVSEPHPLPSAMGHSQDGRCAVRGCFAECRDSYTGKGDRSITIQR